ncbi:MAG: metallophosphoesterase [Hominisplanchenecus sp.]
MKKFKVTRYQIKTKKTSCRFTGKLCIVLLSDLHNECFGRNNDLLLREIDYQNPDLIAIAGDMLTAELEERESIPLSLIQRLAEKYPVCYGNGNHECRMKMDTETFGKRYEYYAEGLRKSGVFLLENEYADLMLKDIPLRIYGLELPQSYYKRYSRQKLQMQEVTEYLGKGTDERYQILLAHNPMCFDAYDAWGADLTMSGHLHGGFLRLPVFGGVISPQFVLFPEYDKGIFEKNGHHMVVSAGTGSHSRLPRIGNPRELVVVELLFTE